MMKKLKLIIPVIIFIIAVIFIVRQFVIREVDLEVSEVNLTVYDYTLSQNEIDVLKDDGYWKKYTYLIPTSDYSGSSFSGQEYGNYLTAYIQIDVYNSKFKYNNCNVTCTMEIAPEDREIFFMYYPNETTPFNAPLCTKNHGEFCPSIDGSSRGRSDEELKDALRRIKLTAYIEHDNGKMDTMDISLADAEINVIHKPLDDGGTCFTNYLNSQNNGFLRHSGIRMEEI